MNHTCINHDFTFRNNDTSAWVLYKRLGSKAEHGKVGGTTPSGTFTVQARTQHTITITHTPTGCSTLFVAPTQTFGHIHSKSVSKERRKMEMKVK